MKRDIENWFTYHAPGPEEQIRYENIRLLGKALAEAIHANCPMGADTVDAIRKVREAVMTANAAIACAPKVMGYAGGPMEATDKCLNEIQEKARYAAIERDRNHNF